MIRRFEFNTIYIIESLESDEKQTGQILYDDLFRWKKEQIDFFDSELFKVNNRIEFFKSIETIKSKTNFQNYPYIHLEIHGNKEGLVLNSDEQVNWEEVANRFREINRLTKNNLLISLATCYGAYIFKEVKPFDSSPFWGFIGPWEQVNSPDIMASYLSFFECMFNSGNVSNIDLNKCIDKLNESESLPYRYYFYNSEQIFESSYAEYERSNYTPEALKERILNLMNKALKDPTIRKSLTIQELRKQIETHLIDKKEEHKFKMRKTFMME